MTLRLDDRPIHGITRSMQATQACVFQFCQWPLLAKLRAVIDAVFAAAPRRALRETHRARTVVGCCMPIGGVRRAELGAAGPGHAIQAQGPMDHVVRPCAAASTKMATRVNPIETADRATDSLAMTKGAIAAHSTTVVTASIASCVRLIIANLTATSATALVGARFGPLELAHPKPGSADQNRRTQSVAGRTSRQYHSGSESGGQNARGAASTRLDTGDRDLPHSPQLRPPLAADRNLHKGWCP